MQISPFAALMIVFVVVAGIMLVVFWLYANRARQFDLTDSVSENGEPAWNDTTRPAEVIAATQSTGDYSALFGLQPGEKLAAPFAEQIEDIIHASQRADPELAERKIDFGTGPGGELEFWIDDEKYDSIESIPAPKVQALIRQAVERFQQHHSS